MKYRKKPVVIEAIRYEGFSRPIMDFANEAELQAIAFKSADDPKDRSLLIDTAEGFMRCDYGDWLIREPFPTGDRMVYPCKPDIFAATYEKVED